MGSLGTDRNRLLFGGGTEFSAIWAALQKFKADSQHTIVLTAGDNFELADYSS